MIDHENALPIDCKLQEYVITGMLGSNEFGFTYTARDSNLDQALVIKECFPKALAARRDGITMSAKNDQTSEDLGFALESFLNEARQYSRVDHPNIVRIFRIFEHNGTGYVVMDWIRGQSLASILDERKSISETDIESWLWPVIEGLKKIHEKNLVHSNIKPENIIMTREGNPVLIGFAAARMAVADRTQSLVTIIEPGYAPLEQYAGSSKQGAWTDIYSLAAIMYRCTTGQAPPAAMDRVNDEELDSPEGVSDKIYSDSLLKGMLAGLAFRGADRPKNLKIWQELLNVQLEPDAEFDSFSTNQSIQRSEAKPAPPSNTPSPPVSPPSTFGNVPVQSVQQDGIAAKSRGVKKGMAIAFLPILVAIAGLYWWMSHNKPDEIEPKSTNAGTEQAAPSSSPESQMQSDPEPDIESKSPAIALEGADLLAGQVYKDCEQCPEMVAVKGGDFEMGSKSTEQNRTPDEGPKHMVRIDAFAIGKYEVTVGEFEFFVRATDFRTDAEKSTGTAGGCFAYKGGTIFGWDSGASYRDPGWSQTSNLPAVCVSWNDAKAYIAWLNRVTGEVYRLPSEAEQEFVIRAGRSSRYPWGSQFSSGCKYANGLDQSAASRFRNEDISACTDSFLFTSPVGSYRPNDFGLYDTVGNVWELAEDCWHDFYNDAPFDARPWIEKGDCEKRVMRGGAWYDGPQYLRSANRGRIGSLTDSHTQVGFRVARDILE